MVPLRTGWEPQYGRYPVVPARPPGRLAARLFLEPLLGRPGPGDPVARRWTGYRRDLGLERWQILIETMGLA